MATGNQQQATSPLPLQEEMGLINYLRGPQAVQPGVVNPIQLAEPSGADLNAIIQEFLRTDGRFLQNMLQQNTSGLYNSTSRKLITNDLLAQAAQKAALAKGSVTAQNAQLAQMATNANAQMSQSAQNANAASGAGKSGKSRAAELALAALIAGFAGSGAGAGKTKDGKRVLKKQSEEGDGNSKGLLDSIAEWFNPSPQEFTGPVQNYYDTVGQEFVGPANDYYSSTGQEFVGPALPFDFAADPATAFNFDTSWLNPPAPVGEMPSYTLPPEYSYSNNPAEQYGPLPESNYLNDIMGPVPDYYGSTGQEFIGPLPEYKEEEEQNFTFDW